MGSEKFLQKKIYKFLNNTQYLTRIIFNDKNSQQNFREKFIYIFYESTTQKKTADISIYKKF